MFRLTARGDRILQAAHIELAVNVRDGLLNQLLGLKIHRIGVLMVNGRPELLELLFVEALVQRILIDFGLVAVRIERSQLRRIVNRMHQTVNLCLKRFNISLTGAYSAVSR